MVKGYLFIYMFRSRNLVKIANQKYDPAEMLFLFGDHDHLMNDLLSGIRQRKHYQPKWVYWRQMKNMAVHSSREELLLNKMSSLKSERYSRLSLNSRKLDSSWADRDSR